MVIVSALNTCKNEMIILIIILILLTHRRQVKSCRWNKLVSWLCDHSLACVESPTSPHLPLKQHLCLNPFLVSPEKPLIGSSCSCHDVTYFRCSESEWIQIMHNFSGKTSAFADGLPKQFLWLVLWPIYHPAHASLLPLGRYTGSLELETKVWS